MLGDHDDADTPAVRFPPPLIFGAALATGLALGRVSSASERAERLAQLLGASAIPAGAFLGLATLLMLKKAGTSASPFKPATALITRGPFAFTRNPAYVGATSLYIGVAMLLRSLPALVLLPVALAVLDSNVVEPEERYLERRFGDAYRSYRETVPRWF